MPFAVQLCDQLFQVFKLFKADTSVTIGCQMDIDYIPVFALYG